MAYLLDKTCVLATRSKLSRISYPELQNCVFDCVKHPVTCLVIILYERDGGGGNC